VARIEQAVHARNKRDEPIFDWIEHSCDRVAGTHSLADLPRMHLLLKRTADAADAIAKRARRPASRKSPER
jgi:hypothetical protein